MVMFKYSKPIILIVDDAPENIDILNNILKDDYIIKTALNGEQALKICEQKEKPDIILLDIVMPGELDGYGILKKLKTEPKTSLIPVIVITIKDTIEDECRALELGAIDFITRPFFPIVVKKRIKNIADIVKINKFKEDISQIISHDLKNPLSIINLELQNIDFNKYPLEIKNMAESIRNSVFRMNNLLLVWSALFKIETYNYEFKPKKIDIIKLLEDNIKHFYFYAELYNIKLNFIKKYDNFFIWADEMLLAPIISNLLKNAIEADSKNSVINVEISVNEKDKKISICFHNHKPIPKEIRENFFEKYSTSGKLNGMGIGTYSAKLFTEIMNGKIKMQSDDKEGTKITIEFDSAQ